MNRYDPNRPCPKCGGHKDACRHEPGSDVIVRICERCDHSWAEWPIDKPADIIVTNDHTPQPHPMLPPPAERDLP